MYKGLSKTVAVSIVMASVLSTSSVAFAATTPSNPAVHVGVTSSVKSVPSATHSKFTKPTAPFEMSLPATKSNLSALGLKEVYGHVVSAGSASASVGVLIKGDASPIFISASDLHFSGDSSQINVLVEHPNLALNTKYTAYLLTGGAVASHSSSDALSSFSFQTGSAVGALANVSVQQATDYSSINSKILTVTATDDYGDGLVDADVSLSPTGSATGFNSPTKVHLTNGVAHVVVSDQSSKSVNVQYTVTDNINNTTKSGNVTVSFGDGASHNYPAPQIPHKHSFVDPIVSNTVSMNAGQQYTSSNYSKPTAPVTFNVTMSKKVLQELHLHYQGNKLVQHGQPSFGVLLVDGSNYYLSTSKMASPIPLGKGLSSKLMSTHNPFSLNYPVSGSVSQGSSSSLTYTLNDNLSYSTDGKTITITASHPTLDRYTKYSAYLVTGSQYQQLHDFMIMNHDIPQSAKSLSGHLGGILQGILHKIDPDLSKSSSMTLSQLLNQDLAKEVTDNHLDGFNFETGSAVGEATHAKVTLASSSTSVTTGGTLNANVTDDYGDPATDATLTLKGSGKGNSLVPSDFSAASTTKITNGTAQVALKDHSAETVALSYSVQDAKYTGSQDSISGSLSETFLPGKTANFKLSVPSKLVAGKQASITGLATDEYGNPVANGTQIKAQLKSGSISAQSNGTMMGTLMQTTSSPSSSTTTTTSSGSFALNATATQAGSDTLTTTATSSGYSTNTTMSVVAGAPVKSEVSIPSSLPQGGTASITGTLTDAYGNPVPNTTITFSGGLSGSLTTNSSGQYSGSVPVGVSGALTATAGGNSITLTNSSGTAITSVTVSSSNYFSVTGTSGTIPVSKLPSLGETVYVTESPSGTPWAVTTLGVFKHVNGAWVNTHFKSTTDNFATALPEYYTQMAFGKNGVIWLSTENQLYKYENGQWSYYWLNAGILTSYNGTVVANGGYVMNEVHQSSNPTRFVYIFNPVVGANFDSSGNLVVAHRNGDIVSMNLSTGKSTTVTSSFPTSDPVSFVVTSKNDNIWALTASVNGNTGINDIYEFTGGKWKKVESNIPSVIGHKLFIMKNGDIAYASAEYPWIKNLYEYNPATGKTSVLGELHLEPDSSPNGLFQDSAGNIFERTMYDGYSVQDGVWSPNPKQLYEYS